MTTTASIFDESPPVKDSKPDTNHLLDGHWGRDQYGKEIWIPRKSKCTS